MTTEEARRQCSWCDGVGSSGRWTCDVCQGTGFVSTLEPESTPSRTEEARPTHEVYRINGDGSVESTPCFCGRRDLHAVGEETWDDLLDRPAVHKPRLAALLAEDSIFRPAAPSEGSES